ncbi:MAG: glycosyltransferase family 4 protein [Nitrospirae bacterium]|nr:glycosyltransferase family 4 protein [Nitrospirota bacterium]
MKILVITSVFPNSKQPALGVFVRERMVNVARHCEIKVIAPVPWFPLVRFLKKNYRPKVEYLEIQDGIEVYHPLFFSIPYFFKFLDGFFFFISSITMTWKVQRNFKFDIIDSHFVYPDGFGSVLLAKLFRKPVTVTVRGTIKKLLKYSLIRIQIKYALNESARIFTVCKDLKNTVMALGVSEGKISVIPNGVDAEKFHPMEKLEARKALGLPEAKKIIISVGGLVERKGFHRVIAVLPAIKKIIPEVMYIIVGGSSVEGDYGSELRRIVKQMDLEKYVMFAGAIPHDRLYKWLSASDIFCLATSNEGWANVFLEAMACGLPVVTTREGGNEEVVSSEEYGLLYNIENEKELSDSIMNALRKNWNKDKIVEFARANSWNVRVNQLLKEFQDLLVNSTPTAL